MGINPNRSLLDFTQIFQRSFDEPNDRIRVDAAVSFEGGITEVTISHLDDSIRLGDGTNLVTATTIGSKTGIDVSIVSETKQNTSVNIYNINVTTINSEVTQMLPVKCLGFIIKSRSSSTIKLSYNPGESGTKYITLKSGAVYEDTHYYTNQSIYFQADKPGIIEITAYSN